MGHPTMAGESAEAGEWLATGARPMGSHHPPMDGHDQLCSSATGRGGTQRLKCKAEAHSGHGNL